MIAQQKERLPSLAQSSNNDRAAIPTLWVTRHEELIAPEEVVGFFRTLHIASESPEVARPGEQHIIVNEDESVTCAIGMKLQDLGCRVDVFTPDTTLSAFAFGIGKDAPLILLETAKPFESWQRESTAPINFENAMKVAKVWLASGRGKVERNIALENLRNRAGVTPFDWNRYIKHLEEEIHAAVDEKSADKDERLRLDLLALTKESDPIKKVRKTSEIASYYRITKNDVERLSRTLEAKTKSAEVEYYTLGEFLDSECEGIDYLIPGLLPRGETVLLSALPKAGKTLLAVDASFSIATGESRFLGEETKRGKVLYVTVDESKNSSIDKLRRRGFRHSDEPYMSVMRNWDVSKMTALEQKLEDFRPDLVVIDSLKRITAGRDISENSAEFSDIIYLLKELTGRYGASCILIHHANKNSEATGVSKVRGSTAITGAVWGVWQLDIPQSQEESGNKPSKAKGKPLFDPTNPNRIFTAICRDTEGALLNIKFNPDNHSYSVANEEDAAVQQERKTQEDLILELLSQHHPNGLTGKEVIDKLRLGRGIYTVLSRMVDRKTVTHRPSKTDLRAMVYALPTRKDTPPPSPSPTLLTNFSQSTVVKPKTNSQHLVNNESTDSQQRFNENKVVDYLNLDPVSTSGDSQQISSTRGGVCVEEMDLTELNTPQLSHPNLDTEVCDEVAQEEIVTPDPWEEPGAEKLTATGFANSPKGFKPDSNLEGIDSTSGDENEQELVEWRDEENLNEMKGYFSSCKNLIQYCQLLNIWNQDVIEEVKASLNPETQAQIKEWEAELANLKSSFQVGDHVYATSQPHTDAMGPYLIERIEGTSAKLECFSDLTLLAHLRKE
jgi:hypothetical protein